MLVVIICLFFASASIAQIDHIDIAIGKSDTIVTNYLNTLFQKKTNPYSKIKKDVTANGDLVLEADFALDDEPYYGYMGIYV